MEKSTGPGGALPGSSAGTDDPEGHRWPELKPLAPLGLTAAHRMDISTGPGLRG